MKTAGDLPEDVVVVVLKEPDGSGFQVYYALRDKPTVRLKAGDLDRMEAGIDIFGTLHVGRGKNEPYEDVYIVTSSKAKDGFGPLLYDVALEVAGPSGLKPDVLDVSDDASALWKYYDDHRADVESRMLVRNVDDFDKVMPDVRAEDPGTNEHLAQVYFKKDRGTTQELMGQDKLVELNPGTKIAKVTPRDELEDLAGELDIPIVKSTDLSRYDRLREDIRIIVGDDEDDLATFEMQDTLQQKVWEGDTRVRPGVKGALMDIVDDFVENLELDAEIKDIIITGSLANYNWSKFSDIDLHILVDFKEVNENEELVRRFFNAVRSNWNKLHDIKVKGHEVELYVQDSEEPHVSTGVYSLLHDKWIVKPNRVKPAIDKATAKKKAANLEREVDKVAAILYDGDHEQALEVATRLKEKIKTMRQGGLERAGIFSPENLAFKMLRRSGAIEKLFETLTAAYDISLSLDQ
jgi:predicted nucleotidyltransferase